MGRLAIGRIVDGTLREGARVVVMGAKGQAEGKIAALFTYEGLARRRADEAGAGENVSIAGIDAIEIGDTVADPADPKALPRIEVEEPTIKMRFGVNTSPFAGKEGKFLTSRQVRERLMREARKNPAIRVEDTESADQFLVYGRGELALAILVETMRRELYELSLGNPEVVTREVDGVLSEPVELVIADVPDSQVGIVTQRLGERRGQMVRMSNPGFGRARVEFEVPSRALIGFRSEFLTSTRGLGLLHTEFLGWRPWGGPMLRRANGALVADRAGEATPYALFHLQPRGEFFVGPGAPVYEGMIIGEHNRPNDSDVNAVREKKLTNVRNHGKDENVMLYPPKVLTVETAMEWIDRDELVEVTPHTVRVRKAVLAQTNRPRRTENES